MKCSYCKKRLLKSEKFLAECDYCKKKHCLSHRIPVGKKSSFGHYCPKYASKTQPSNIGGGQFKKIDII